MSQTDTLHTDSRFYIVAELTIFQRNPDKIVFYSCMSHIQAFTRTIFADISAANFRNPSFTGQSVGESERTYGSRLN